MTKLLLDMGLPRRAAVDLRERGFDVWHAGELGLAREADEVILAFAAREDYGVVTLDSEFARLVSTRSLFLPSVVHLRLSHLNRSRTVQLLADLIPRLEDELAAGCIASVTPGGIRVRRLRER